MIPEKITYLPSIENYNLHKESFKWILLKIAKDISSFKNIEGLKNYGSDKKASDNGIIQRLER